MFGPSRASPWGEEPATEVGDALPDCDGVGLEVPDDGVEVGVALPDCDGVGLAVPDDGVGVGVALPDCDGVGLEVPENGVGVGVARGRKAFTVICRLPESIALMRPFRARPSST